MWADFANESVGHTRESGYPEVQAVAPKRFEREVPVTFYYSRDLKRCLLIFNDRILDSRVVDGMPSFLAAPEGPDTRP